MKYQMIEMGEKKKIALVAHDNKKRDLLEWAKFNRDLLAGHKLYATGTTGNFLEEALGAKLSNSRAAPWAAINRSGQKLPRDKSILSFFSGTPWNRSRMIRTSKRC